MSYGSSQKVQKVMVQPINLIFRYLQNRTRVAVWLYENVNTRCSLALLVRFCLFIHLLFFIRFCPYVHVLCAGSRATSWASTST